MSPVPVYDDQYGHRIFDLIMDAKGQVKIRCKVGKIFYEISVEEVFKKAEKLNSDSATKP